MQTLFRKKTFNRKLLQSYGKEQYFFKSCHMSDAVAAAHNSLEEIPPDLI